MNEATPQIDLKCRKQVVFFMFSSAFQCRYFTYCIRLLVNLENVLVLEQVLRNLLSSGNAELTTGPPPPSLGQLPALYLVPTNQTEQPLDLSMKADMSPTEDFGYGSGSERPNELHEMGMEDLFLKHQVQPCGQRLTFQCRFL